MAAAETNTWQKQQTNTIARFKPAHHDIPTDHRCVNGCTIPVPTVPEAFQTMKIHSEWILLVASVSILYMAITQFSRK
jgi:hypothetical protein